MSKWIDELLRAYVRVTITVMIAITAIIFLCSFQTAEFEDEIETMEYEEMVISDLQAIPVEEWIETREPKEPKPAVTYYGTKQLTAYVATGNPCADGVYPVVGYTAASNDPNLWHKWVHIEGYGDYYIHDTGGMSTNVIDIFFGSYSEAVQFGRREAEVYVYE